MNTEVVLLVFQVLGGLSIFLFGMHIMTQGLRAAAGTTLRTVLARTSRHPLTGAALGTLLGFLAHSGAATTMIAGFVNAGLMGLAESIAPTIGANIGTSLSMQLLSFDLGRYCWIAIGLGYVLHAAIPRARLREVGRALLGFGLIFLGMTTISAALAPHSDLLTPWLARIEGSSWRGRLTGIALSALLTALITSSGATIGLCFALISAGIIDAFDEVFPIVLGAHIGTCVVVLTASLAMNVEARRAAVAHLMFNVFNVALACIAYPWVQRIITWSSPTLIRQAANLHTFAMVGAGLIAIPLAPLGARLLRIMVPSRQPLPERSHLDEDLLTTPEQALCAVIRELRRAAKLCVESILINGHIILRAEPKLLRRLHANEDAINEIRSAIRDYLRRLTERKLSRRQTLFLQHLDRCVKDIERIGDHLRTLADTASERLHYSEALLPEDLFAVLYDLVCAAKHVLVLTERSLDPDNERFEEMAQEILKARDIYMIMSMDAKAEMAGAIEQAQITPLAGYYANHMIADLDRLVRHAKSIAFAERQPDFWIKHGQFQRGAPSAHPYTPPLQVDPKSYLARLYRDDLFDEPEEKEPSTGEAVRLSNDRKHGRF
jgi:phosphate:Na+ symporter